MTRCFASARPIARLLLASGLLLAGCSSKDSDESAAEPDGPSRRVVAYVANVSPTGEFCRLPEGCQFRLLDPRSGGDELVIQLNDIPRNIFWDPGYAEVHFRQGARLYRAAWRKGAQPEAVLELPEVLAQRAETIEDIWQDATTKNWRIKSLEYEGEGARRQAIAGVWEFDAANKQWSVLDKQPTECECGDCPCAEIMNRWRLPAPRVALRETLGNMGIAWHLERSRPGEEWDEGHREFISMAYPGTSYGFELAFGDTYHAMAPFVVNTGTGGEPQTVYPAGGPCGDQLAFMEDEGFLLVTAEYTGSCARLISLHSGAVVKPLAENTLGSVWVARPAPLLK